MCLSLPDFLGRGCPFGKGSVPNISSNFAKVSFIIAAGWGDGAFDCLLCSSKQFYLKTLTPSSGLIADNF